MNAILQRLADALVWLIFAADERMCRFANQTDDEHP